MKKIYKIFTCGLLFLAGACNSWLDVDLVNQEEESKLFSTEQGFHEALAGVYSKMSKDGMYGRTYVFGMIEILGQTYERGKLPELEKKFSTYTYEDQGVKDKIASIWLSGYSAISSTNNLLRWIEKNGGVMKENVRNQIKGEALALRAFLHFDIYRMFAPDIKQNATIELLPYNTVFGVETPSVCSNQAFLESVLDDLRQAEELLVNDPIEEVLPWQLWSSGDIPNRDPADLYVARMSLYAVKALMARVYLAKNDVVNARLKAGEVIHSGKFRLVDMNKSIHIDNPKLVDALFSDEHIFSLRNKAITDYVKSAFNQSEDANATYQKPVRTIEGIIYEGNNEDIRLLTWFDRNMNNVEKYKKDNAKTFSPKVPLIKLSEMYLIAAESFLQERPDSALVLLNTLRESRIGDNTADLDVITEDVLVKEMQREYMCEGQMFFQYKRLNRKIWGGSTGMDIEPSDRVFRFPLPDAEIENGNRVQKN